MSLVPVTQTSINEIVDLNNTELESIPNVETPTNIDSVTQPQDLILISSTELQELRGEL